MNLAFWKPMLVWFTGVMILLALLAFLAACNFLPGSGGEGAVPDPGKVSPASSGNRTDMAVWVMGAVTMLAGVAIVAGRFLGWHTAPLIGGILTLASGISVMVFADLMAEHWWVKGLLLSGLIGLGVVEWMNDRDLLSKDAATSTGVLSSLFSRLKGGKGGTE